MMWMRTGRMAVVQSALVMLGALPAQAQVAANPAGRTLELGARTGPAWAFGDRSGSFTLAIPVWLDAAYRFNPYLAAGAYAQLAFLEPDTSDGSPCYSRGSDCSGTDVRFGLQATIRLLPDNRLDPWMRLGVGYEFFHLSAPTDSRSESRRGWEFANFQVGAQWGLTQALAVGPFFSFSLGQYTYAYLVGYGNIGSAPRPLHEWLVLGLRFSYDAI